MRNLLLAAAAALPLAAAPAHAAWIVFDDSNLDTITISAGGFNGFFLDTAIVPTFTLQSGITYADGEQHVFSATILGQAVPILVNSYREFALPSAPTSVTSYMSYYYDSTITTEAIVANLTGTFAGSGGIEPYFYDILGAIPQDGRTVTVNLFGLDLTFITEATEAPEPASLTLFALATAALAATRRRKRGGSNGTTGP